MPVTESGSKCMLPTTLHSSKDCVDLMNAVTEGRSEQDLQRLEDIVVKQVTTNTNSGIWQKISKHGMFQ